MTGRQGGFTYLGLLFWVALTGVGLGAVSEIWSTSQRRENEYELIFIGEQFRAALERHGATGRFPKRLEDLLGDDKSVPPGRYLRNIYIDPMTGKADWGLVTLPDGQIIGVHSLSDKEPLKQAGFSDRYADFAGRKRYSEWVFYAANAPRTAFSPSANHAAGGFGKDSGAFSSHRKPETSAPLKPPGF